jgi:two-component system osmolarity sensor histidine kinase EnvZ
VKARGSLFRRTAITVAAALAVFQVAAAVAVTAYVLVPIARRSADDLAAFLVLSARTWVELPPETRPAFAAELAESHRIAMTDAPDRHEEEVRHHPYMNLLRDALSRRLGGDASLRVAELEDGRFHVDIPMAERALHFTFARDLLSPSPLVALWWILAAGIVVTLATAWLLARRVAAPVAGMAEAARQIGAGEHPARLPEEGARELAGLARAFNETADRLAEQRANQATLLAGVSHDLRTPLARLRMALGVLAEERASPLVERMEGDVAEMDALIGAQLALSRAREREEAIEADVDALLAERAAAASAVAPGEVRLRADGGACHEVLAPLALQRIVANLLDNALAHGGGRRVDIVRRRCGGALYVGVRDRGPGIPAALREAVFRPFFRLEPSRNRATGGSGLGLAISRQLAETHGWRLALKARRGGGTSAWLAIAAAGVPGLRSSPPPRPAPPSRS